ncbi:ulk kinase [Cystoisospora suis]|uniref:non-specific serine/threonine protein kinase n=1 Tax=Cystoisospora suis TaxID=483139 RepID=A0A2C6L2W3_9APIC|nr:ulk kinase [Cystoisospora suis]
MGGTASRGEKSSSSSSSSASASASSPPAPRSSSLRVKPLSSSLQRCLPFVCLCPNGVCTKPKNIRRDTASSSSPLHQPRYVSAGRAGDETGAVLVVGVDHTPAADLNAALTQRKRLKGNFKKKYTLGKILGSGAFGQVRECANKQTKEAFAVKIISRRARERGPWSSSEMFRREVMLLSALSHPNIIRLIDAFEDRHHLYYVMEKCDGGELFEHIVRRKHFDEHEASRLCRQMLSALEYLHSFDIVHRDIKAENFLFRGKNVASSLVLIDFGMSARVLPNQSLTEVGRAEEEEEKGRSR